MNNSQLKITYQPNSCYQLFHQEFQCNQPNTSRELHLENHLVLQQKSRGRTQFCTDESLSDNYQ